MGVIDDLRQQQGKLVGLPTGFPDLDHMTGGIREDDYWVLAARPSMGKTTLASNIALHVALVAGKPVVFFSGESSRGSLVRRMLCSEARVDLRKVRAGLLEEPEILRLAAAATKISRSPLRIIECFGHSIMQLRAKARRVHQRDHTALFVFDYMQKFSATNARGHRIENRQQEVAEVSGGLANLAKELHGRVLALCQLNRQKGKPDLTCLRESGAIEQDGDFVGLLYKPEKEEGDAELGQGEAESVLLEIAKQRDGPTGVVSLVFRKQFTRFESAAKVAEDDAPTLFK
jgi:replicative DNA helicase